MRVTRFGNAPLLVRATLVASLGALLVAPMWALPVALATGVVGAMHAVTLLVALTAMVRSARRSDPAGRLFRWCLAGSLVAVAAGSVIGIVLTATTGAIPVPSVGDPVTMAWVPIALFGLWRVPRRNAELSAGPLRLIADTAVAVTSLLFASYLWVLEPLASTGRWTPLGQVVQTSYPLMDVAVAATAISLLPRVRADVRPFLNCVAAGLVLVVVSDSGSVLILAQRGASSFGWPDVTLQAGMMLLAFAARLRVRPVIVEQRASGFVDRNLVYLPIAVASVLCLLHVWLVGPLGLTETALGTTMLLAVVLRQALHGSALGSTAEEHRRASVQDALTGLSNRKAFLSRLHEHLITPGAEPAAVVLFDLDGFKEVNDTLGHDAGDEVLIGFSWQLALAAASAGTATGGGSAGSTGMAARLGGDEFALLVVGEDPEERAVRLAHRINALSSDPQHEGRRGVRGSAGIAAVLPVDTPSEVMRRADLAMYAAKRGGESGVQVFTPALTAKADRRNLLIGALAGAAERGELHVVYQPLFRLSDSHMIGAEVLLRWSHPLLGDVTPDEFIPLAEDTGAIVAIGRWVRHAALEQVATWDASGLVLPRLFVNVAAGEFTETLPDEVRQLCAQHRIAPDRIALEITESRLPDGRAATIMNDLRASGILIALDDFGTGYSSLSQLAHLPVDILKIDRDFIRNLGEASGRPMLDAIVTLGRALGLTTVAEGIEHLDQAAEAANAGLDIAQGYLFSRPLPAERFHELFSEQIGPSDRRATGREVGPQRTSAAVPQPRPGTEAARVGG